MAKNRWAREKVKILDDGLRCDKDSYQNEGLLIDLSIELRIVPKLSIVFEKFKFKFFSLDQFLDFREKKVNLRSM